MPSCHSGKVSGVDRANVERVQKRVSTGCRPFSGVVVKVFRPRVEAANTLLLVTKACADGLGDVQHVGNVVPAVRVVNRCQILVNTARSIFFEEPDQRIRTWSTIEPERKGVFGRIVARFEKPIEYVDLYCLDSPGMGVGTGTHVWSEVYISRIAVYTWGGLANTRVLVPDGNIVRGRSGLVVVDFLWQVHMLSSLAPLLLGDSIDMQRQRRERQ